MRKLKKRRSINPADRRPGGNLTIYEIADIAKTTNYKITVPPTLIVGSMMKQNDRRIWTDPQTGRIKCLKGTCDQG